MQMEWLRLLAALLLLPEPSVRADPTRNVQKGQNLGIGACNKEPPNFCDRIVQNSVCNRAKNECFCRKGFVAIKEGASVACKTLLTDLICRVDEDCVHINRSICHPGAGYCTCPGNTVFVPQLNACRTKSLDRKSLICASCLQEGGNCFAYEKGDQSSDDNLPSYEPYGCVCSNMRTNTQFRDPARPQRTCGAQLVDIGELCNGEDLRCRSPLAICKPLEESSWSDLSYQSTATYGTCECPPEYIPVFQKLLRYSECYPLLSFREKSCKSCIKNGGACFRLTETRTDCQCPLDRSNAHSDTSDSGVCRYRHVQTVCENAFLLVCYTPHWGAPFEDLGIRMESGAAEARLGSPSLSISSPNFPAATGETCRLSKVAPFDERNGDMSSSLSIPNTIAFGADLWRVMLLKLSVLSPDAKNATMTTPYCTQIDLTNTKPGCGIRVYNMGGGRLKYQGMVEVLMEEDTNRPTTTRDLHLSFTCIDHKISRERQEQLFQTRLHNVNVSMTVVNERQQEVDQVSESESVSLQFRLISPTTGSVDKAQGAITVESCFASISGSQFSPPSLYSGYPVYVSGCTTNNEAYRIQFDQSKLSGRTLQTPFFQVFRIENYNSLFIRCFIKYCPQSTPCLVEDLDCSDPAQAYSSTKRLGSDYRLFDRWVHLNIASTKAGNTDGRGNTNLRLNAQNNMDEKDSNGNAKLICRFAVCLTQAQLISLSVITTLIILVVLTISLIALRRQNQFRRNELTNSKKPNSTPYEYVNWSTPIANREWVNQTSALQPIVLADSTIQRNPVSTCSSTSGVYSAKIQSHCPTFIRSPNNAFSLFPPSSPMAQNEPDASKCRSFPDMKRMAKADNAAAWTISRPVVTSKKNFVSPVNQSGPFELHPLEAFETETPNNPVSLYAPFLCIQETGTIKNNTRGSEYFVVPTSSTTTVGQDSLTTSVHYVLQNAPAVGAQTLTTQATRRYNKPAIANARMDGISSIKIFPSSEDEITRRDVPLASSNILSDEQNV